MEMTRILAALLSAFMLLGLAACGQGMPDYLAEVQKVNEWKCYEMNVDLAFDFQAEPGANASELLFGVGETGPDSSNIKVELDMLVDLESESGRLSGGFETDVRGLETYYGMRNDIHGVYDRQTEYLKDGVAYLPVKLVRDVAAVEIGYSAANALDDMDQEYIALDLEAEENSPADRLLQPVPRTAEQYRALGALYQDYATNLRFQKSGRTYTLTGAVEQLPAEIVEFYRFICENAEELNDILQLGLDGEEILSMLETAEELKQAADEVKELETQLKEQGVGGTFSVKISFEDRQVTQQYSLNMQIKGYGKLEMSVQSTMKKREAVTLDIPEATEPMTADELEDLLYDWDWDDGGYGYDVCGAVITLEDGWMYSYGPSGDSSGPCPVLWQGDACLLGFRTLMESMGFGVEYDAATDTIYFIDESGVPLAVDLYEENGQSFISLPQLSELGFHVETMEEDGTVSIWLSRIGMTVDSQP